MPARRKRRYHGPWLKRLRQQRVIRLLIECSIDGAIKLLPDTFTTQEYREAQRRSDNNINISLRQFAMPSVSLTESQLRQSSQVQEIGQGFWAKFRGNS